MHFSSLGTNSATGAAHLDAPACLYRHMAVLRDCHLHCAGTRELTIVACTFGNTLTLPLIFMMSLLPAAAFDRAVGYTALFLVGWSPLLWSLGYSQLSSAGFSPEDESRNTAARRFGANFEASDVDDEMSTARIALATGAGLKRDSSPNRRAVEGTEAGRKIFRDLRRAYMRVCSFPYICPEYACWYCWPERLLHLRDCPGSDLCRLAAHLLLSFNECDIL